MTKTPNEAYALLDEIATNGYQWPSERSNTKKVAGLHVVDPITTLAAQMLSLTNQLAATDITWNSKESRFHRGSLIFIL